MSKIKTSKEWWVVDASETSSMGKFCKRISAKDATKAAEIAVGKKAERRAWKDDNGGDFFHVGIDGTSVQILPI